MPFVTTCRDLLQADLQLEAHEEVQDCRSGPPPSFSGSFAVRPSRASMRPAVVTAQSGGSPAPGCGCRAPAGRFRPSSSPAVHLPFSPSPSSRLHQPWLLPKNVDGRGEARQHGVVACDVRSNTAGAHGAPAAAVSPHTAWASRKIASSIRLSGLAVTDHIRTIWLNSDTLWRQCGLLTMMLPGHAGYPKSASADGELAAHLGQIHRAHSYPSRSTRPLSWSVLSKLLASPLAAHHKQAAVGPQVRGGYELPGALEQAQVEFLHQARDHVDLGAASVQQCAISRVI
jgi:hypothetical protein